MHGVKTKKPRAVHQSMMPIPKEVGGDEGDRNLDQEWQSPDHRSFANPRIEAIEGNSENQQKDEQRCERDSIYEQTTHEVREEPVRHVQEP